MVPTVPLLPPLALTAAWFAGYLHPGQPVGVPGPLDPESFDVLDQLLAEPLLGAVRGAMGTEAGVLGSLGFDPFVNGQDFDLGSVRLETGPLDPESADKAEVKAAVENFGVVSRMTFDFRRGDDGRWRLADWHCEGPGDDDPGWRLIELLRRPSPVGDIDSGPPSPGG